MLRWNTSKVTMMIMVVVVLVVVVVVFVVVVVVGVVRMVKFKSIIMIMQVREDLCLVHEAYQYFRFYFNVRFNTVPVFQR